MSDLVEMDGRWALALNSAADPPQSISSGLGGGIAKGKNHTQIFKSGAGRKKENIVVEELKGANPKTCKY